MTNQEASQMPFEENRPDARYVCDDHHWISKGANGLLIRWVIECSICGVYNVEEMNRYTRQVGAV